MGLFKSLFGSPEPAKPEAMQVALDALHEFAYAVMQPVDELEFLADELRRQVLCAYCFGSIHILAERHRLTVPETHALMLAFLNQRMGYSPEAATQQAQALIDATGDPDPGNTLKAIAHRGLDGFLAWQSSPRTFQPTQFDAILVHLQQAGSA